MEIKVKAYAKINLMLDIIYKRTDGYHDPFYDNAEYWDL